MSVRSDIHPIASVRWYHWMRQILSSANATNRNDVESR